MTSTIHCKKCGREGEPSEFKKVADSSFCPDCFTQLIAGVEAGEEGREPPREEKSPPKPSDSPTSRVGISSPAEDKIDLKDTLKSIPSTEGPKKEPASPPSSTFTGIQYCEGCGAETAAEDAIPIDGKPFCGSCYKTLLEITEMERQKKREELDRRQEEVKQENLKYVEKAEKLREERPATECANCSRPIQAGSYHVIEDTALCPDCFYAWREKHEEKRKPGEWPGGKKPEGGPKESPVSGEVNRPAAELTVCESCGRTMPQSLVETEEGFALCRSCVQVDREAALVIARGRHQEKLDSQ